MSGSNAVVFRALSVMLGRTAAAYSFLRPSNAVSAPALEVLIVNADCSDDFTLWETDCNHKSAKSTKEKSSNCLGGVRP